ncbi:MULTISPECIES: hypothetical protein [Ralstonia]|uniref:hypothetical protein n=1 Tax=Ralstonia TaxID=48736 RepID=UPI00136225EE|nr:hypothetical protein [Ralstonia pickettii]
MSRPTSFESGMQWAAPGSGPVVAHVIDSAHLEWDINSLNTRRITDTLARQRWHLY